MERLAALITHNGDYMAERAPKLIVVMAFDRDEEGELQPVFEPLEQQSEDQAIRTAQALADKHAGVIAWSREDNPLSGEYGGPNMLFVSGDVPEME